MTNESIKMMAQLRNEIVPGIDDAFMREVITQQIDRILRCEVNDLQFKISKFNIYKYLDKDDLRPVMRCVFYDKGYRVASDAKILVATKLGYIPENEGKMIDKYGNECKEGVYPVWRSVIPSIENNYHCDITLDVDETYKKIKNEIKVNKDSGSLLDKIIALRFNDSNGNEMFKYYSPDHFILLLEAMKSHGINAVSEVERSQYGFNNPLLSQNENAKIILMPMYGDYSDKENEQRIIRIN